MELNWEGKNNDQLHTLNTSEKAEVDMVSSPD